MRTTDVRRVLLGTFVRPAEETGTDKPRVEAVFGYLAKHPAGLVLLDTGIGDADAETNAWYRPQRIPLPQVLADQGVSVADIDLVVNCHLHFDHCGGNPQFGGTPVICQRRELAAAHGGEYTLPELVDYVGARYELLDGEAEVLPGVHVIPTPGHVEGHQSLVIECDDGTVILAGQSHDAASAWSADALAAISGELGHTEPLPAVPTWMSRLLEFDPKRVFFAHDAAVWEPS
ncbi:N-acyl homoserine lactonase family protein [Jatrophihabitans sp. DSM 45814]